MKTVECVPNFSEGRDQGIITEISNAIRTVDGVTLLDVSSGYDTNRTVYTFAGSPDAVFDAAFSAIERGIELIDMSHHRGTHPRIGACDVCPFVPVQNIDMDECVKIARKLGKQVGSSLKIPVYLYGHAAIRPARVELSAIRSGEYEGLAKKLKNPLWKPDYGPSQYTKQVKRSGAAVVGARDFLIAFNINLNTEDRTTAQCIAGRIREKGRVVIDDRGNRVHIPGSLRFCRAIGWYIELYKRAQVSINLTNYTKTNMHHAFEAAAEEADSLDVRVTGSEIVGLVPKEAVLESGRFFLQQKGKSQNLPEHEVIRAAVGGLGLSELEEFAPDKKIIEYML